MKVSVYFNIVAHCVGNKYFEVLVKKLRVREFGTVYVVSLLDWTRYTHTHTSRPFREKFGYQLNC